MANRKRSKPAPAAAAEPRKGRSTEILGILIATVGVMVGIAVLSHSDGDADAVASRSFVELFVPVPNQEVGNALGPVGAYLSHALVPASFGYPVVLLPLLLMILGYVVLRHKHLHILLRPSLWIIGLGAYTALFMGRLDRDLGADLGNWSGAFGAAAAEWMTGVTGWLGSWVIIALAFVVGLMMLIDHDIQRWLDRIEHAARSLGGRVRESGRSAKHFVQQARESEAKADQTSWEDLEGPQVEASVETQVADDSDAAPAPDADDQEVAMRVVAQVAEEEAQEVKPRKAVTDGGVRYRFPSVDLLETADEHAQHIDRAELEENKTKLLEKLARYKIEITNINAVVGPTVTLYELTPSPGVKISSIRSRENDLAMEVAAASIRMIVPIPGKSAVGVEIPNRRRELVRLRSIIGTARFRDTKMELPVALGKTIEGEVYLQDLAQMPHLLIAGATGSGKSVCLNTLIAGLLYACHPSNLKFVMVDPKKIELQQYRELEQHYLAMPEDGKEAVITEVEDTLGVLAACLREMEARYDLLKDARVRGIKDYNEVYAKGQLDPDLGHKHLPYIVVIVDELADLMMTAGRDVEGPIARLAQMARAVGIHLVLATQRPSVDVITGLIKANFPSRVAFQVASKIDARTILDQNGAEQLVGNGDMLYMAGSRLVRLQGPFVSVSEIDRLMDFIQSQPGPGPYRLSRVESDVSSDASGGSGEGAGNGHDALFEEAARIIVRNQQGSVSLIQRKLSIGYTRAARIVDQLEQAGIVGAFQGAKAREVLVRDEVELDGRLGG